jgi:hypothetical protein
MCVVSVVAQYNVDPSMSKVNLLNKVKKCQQVRCGYHHHMGRGEMRKLFLV